MIILTIFGLIASVVICALVLWLKRNGIQYPMFPMGIAFLLIQAAYLSLVLFDNAPDSETWMGLALTYIPLSVVFFAIISILSIARMLKEEKGLGRLKAFGIIPIHGIGSYLILYAWGYIFQFPL